MLRRLLTVSFAVALLVPTSAAHADPVVTTWSPERNLSLPGAAAFSPDIVSASDGNTLIAAWHRYDLLFTRIQVSRSTDGGQTWTTPRIISDNEAYNVELAVTPDASRAVAVWLRSDLVNNRVEAATSTDGGLTWTAQPFLSAAGQSASRTQVRISNDGNRVMAIWERVDAGKVRVQATFSTDGGGTWSTPETLSSAGTNAEGSQFTLSADGQRAAAVWQEATRVYAARTIDGGTTWSAPAMLATDISTTPVVAGSSNGTSLASLWSTPVAPNPFISSSRSGNSGSTWSAPVNISPAAVSRDPRIASSADGVRMIAAWRQGTMVDPYRIVSARSTDGGQTWTAGPAVSTAGKDARTPRLVTSSDGSFATLAWEEYDGAKYRVRTASTTDQGQTWSTPQVLSGAGQDGFLFGMSADENGRRVATVWDRSDGTHQRIQVATGTVASSPGAPGQPTASPGDGTATISWPAADDRGSPITGYTATTGTQTCTTPTTSCTLTGLTNGTSYSVTVTATNALGTGPASAATTVTPTAPVPTKRTKALVKAVSRKSLLRVIVKPNLGPNKQWQFSVQRKKGATWRTVGASRSTIGPTHRRIVNLPRGVYRVQVKAARGYAASTSKAIRLRR